MNYYGVLLREGYFYFPPKEAPFFFDGEKIIKLVPNEEGKWVLPEEE